MSNIIVELPQIDPEKMKEVISIRGEKRIIVTNNDERGAVYNKCLKATELCNFFTGLFKKPKELADKAHKGICASESSVVKPLRDYIKIGKEAIISYDNEVERKAEAERRRLQAIEDERVRKEKEKKEAEAAKQRQIEEEQRRKAEEARKQAEQASEAERVRLLKEAEEADRKAAAANAKAEVKEEAAASIIPPVVQVAPPTQKQEGESKRSTWKAKIIDIRQVPTAYYLNNPKVMDAIQAALDAFARGTKGAVPVQGILFIEEKSLAIAVK